MPLLLLVAYCLLLVKLDMYVTRKRVQEYGVNVELNPLARSAMKRWGAFTGSILGIFIPNLVVFSTLAAARWDRPLLFLAGFKTCWALLSLYSIHKLKNER